MKKCNICGTDVSDQATSCPVCGQNLEPVAYSTTTNTIDEVPTPTVSENTEPTQHEEQHYCTVCGHLLKKNENFCPGCGSKTIHSNYVGQSPINQQVNQNYSSQNNQAEDKANVGLAILSFIIPLVGIILGIVSMKETPKAGRTYLIVGLIPIILSIVFNVVIAILAK